MKAIQGGKDEMIDGIFEEIRAERQRQDEKFGKQNHSMLGKTFDLIDIGRMYPHKNILRNQMVLCRERIKSNKHGWFDILLKELCESFLETEPEKQREEMIQVAAVAVQIIESLDKRIGGRNERKSVI
jgi:GH18 family chitinase